ncbi:MAG: BrnA antitoxin family protein [Zoogloeaceae bacterium]|jgi:hypothetical protein|nr:BrnA antitoxin family protein [Zoogloeaceae bacterium]
MRRGVVLGEYDFSGGARGARGARGAIIKSSGKTRVTLYLDDDVLEAFRLRSDREGRGYQTLINEALRGVIDPDSVPFTLGLLRQVLREEFGIRLAPGETG